MRCNIVFAIFCILCISAGPVQGARSLQDGTQTLTGQVSVVAKDYFLKGVPPGRDFFLEMADDTVLLTPGKSGINLWTTLLTGQTVTVTGAVHKPSDRGPVMDIATLRIDRQPEGSTATERQSVAQMDHSGRSMLQVAPTTTSLSVTRANMNTLIIPMTFEGCSKSSGGNHPAVPYTKASVTSVAFGTGDITTAASLAQAYQVCSYGKSYLNTSNSIVADIVQIPCTAGTNACSATDSWADYAVKGAINQGIDVTKYGYRVFIIPPTSSCTWKGLGTVNCKPASFYSNTVSTGLTNCRSWVNGGFYASPMVALHEQGHNLGLAHSATITSTFSEIEDYGDRSSLMGYCHDGSPDKQCITRCYNQPHSWQLGWTNPLIYNSTSLPANSWTSVTFKSLLRSDQSGVKIATATWQRRGPPIYLGYRIAESVDTPLSLIYNNYFDKTNIYMFAGLSNTDYKQPGWLTAVGDGEQYTVSSTGGLTIRQTSHDNTAGTVTVSICRGTCVWSG